MQLPEILSGSPLYQFGLKRLDFINSKLHHLTPKTRAFLEIVSILNLLKTSIFTHFKYVLRPKTILESRFLQSTITSLTVTTTCQISSQMRFQLSNPGVFTLFSDHFLSSSEPWNVERIRASILPRISAGVRIREEFRRCRET